ncbi:hypothetical protein K1719_021431 [Acacia pycnantha]|nr:hypothetical protein K1719_021431 [Acacia pycnantha]
MEFPWQNWFSDLDMDETGFFNNQSQHKTYSFDEDDDEFLKEIFHRPCFSSESDSTHSSSIQNNNVTTTAASYDGGGGSAAGTTPTTTVSSLPLDIDSGGSAGQLKPNGSGSSILSILGSFSDNRPAIATSPPSTYILSFDNSTVLRATSCEVYRRYESTVKSGNQEKLESSTGGGGSTMRDSQQRILENHNSDSHQPKTNNQGTKRTRNSSETMDHIMAERKRRQELTEKFIALSATIPGLKKIDKASILSEAIIHVKQLQERVKELEEQNKMMNSTVESSSSYKMMMTKKTKKKSSLLSLSNNNNDEETTSGIDDHYFRINEALPEVEARVIRREVARVIRREVLIRIHCENQKGIILNLLAQLNSLHFSIVTHSALPFGNSILDITIIAEGDEEHNIPVEELVKKLRKTLLKKSVD